ncbi:hypothetical protein ACSU1N_00980 [Thermogladius sp. 4427co]|uniref:hypothetical protein n=1 Tax=Thermogladius sp. 4427co TaxID=3450718 RepID=UPI003F79BC55
MYIRGVNYGLTLYYSYSLPLFEIEETSNGFVFRKAYGYCRNLNCRHNKHTMDTECYIPSDCEAYEPILGLDKTFLFREFLEKNGMSTNRGLVTLVYSVYDRELIAYSIFLSQNTVFHVNTVKWLREFLSSGYVNSGSYQVREFMNNYSMVKTITGIGKPFVEAIRLMDLRLFSVKSANAYLLHAYGLTEYAPIDRHYMYYLKGLGLNLRTPSKKVCKKNGLRCEGCRFSSKCLYAWTRSKFGYYNGVIQSIAYIARSLGKTRHRNVDVLVSGFEDIVEAYDKLLKSFINKISVEK